MQRNEFIRNKKVLIDRRNRMQCKEVWRNSGTRYTHESI